MKELDEEKRKFEEEHGPVKEEVNENEWTCKECTVINSNEQYRCSCCAAINRELYKEKLQKDKEWTCRFCKVVNTMSFCNGCMKSKYTCSKAEKHCERCLRTKVI